MWQLVLYLSFVVRLCYAMFWSSDHLMHVRRRLLDFGCAIAVVNAFVMLLCHD